MPEITNDRGLSAVQLELINKVKAKADEVGELTKECENLAGIDGRWLAISRTDLQKAFMSLVRAIAKPPGF